MFVPHEWMDKVNVETVHLKLFPFSLKDKAKSWFNSLRPNSITTWVQMQESFLMKLFSMRRTHAFQGKIMHFSQKPDEAFNITWERFKELQLACTHHGFSVSNLMQFFYNGLLPATKEKVELFSNGNLFEKTQFQAWEHFDFIAENSQRWETISEYDRLSTPTGGGYDNIEA